MCDARLTIEQGQIVDASGNVARAGRGRADRGRGPRVNPRRRRHVPPQSIPAGNSRDHRAVGFAMSPSRGHDVASPPLRGRAATAGLRRLVRGGFRSGGLRPVVLAFDTAANVATSPSRWKRIAGDRWIFRPPGVWLCGARDRAGLTRYKEADVVLNLCGAQGTPIEHEVIRCSTLRRIRWRIRSPRLGHQGPMLAVYAPIRTARTARAADCGVPVEGVRWQPTHTPMSGLVGHDGISGGRGMTTVC